MLEDRTVLSPVTFTVDPNNSQLTLSGDVAGSPIREQGSGSLTSSYTGSFDTDVNLTAGTITFIDDGPTVNANDSGSWQPLPGGDAGSAPANYGAIVDTALGTALAGLREDQLAASSGPLALSGDGPTYSFPSMQTVLIKHGFADYRVNIFIFGRQDLTGNSGMNMASDGSLTDNGDGTLSITVPVHVTISATVGGQPANLNIDGMIAGNGSFSPGPFHATGALRQAYTTLSLQPVVPQVIDLAELPSFDMHPIQISVVFHQSLQDEGGPGPLAVQNWVTYIGGTVNTDTGRGIAVDAAGNSYVTGWTEGGNQMGFVAKYDAAGNQVYLTAFQATDPDFTYINTEAHAIAVDAAGNAYVTGKATNTLFGETDAYALKLSADGSTLVYSTAFGNPPFDAGGNGIAVDGSGQATVTGSLKSSFVQTNIFAVKVNAAGTGLIWQAYYQFQGYTDSAGNAIALNNDATIAFMAGWIIPSSGDKDLFALKVDNATGQPTGAISAFTTPPNLGDDMLNGIAVDNAGNPYVVGTLVVSGTNPEAYFAKIQPDFSDSVYATVFDNTNAGWGIAVNSDTGEVYGTGSEPDGLLQHTFVVKLNPAGVDTDDTELLGDGTDIGYGIGFSKDTGTAYLTGSTTSTNLSTDGTTLTGFRDAFLASYGSFT